VLPGRSRLHPEPDTPASRGSACRLVSTETLKAEKTTGDMMTGKRGCCSKEGTDGKGDTYNTAQPITGPGAMSAMAECRQTSADSMIFLTSGGISPMVAPIFFFMKELLIMSFMAVTMYFFLNSSFSWSIISAYRCM